jgi:transposase
MFPIFPLALVLAADLAAPAIHDVSIPTGLRAVTSNPEFSGIVWSPAHKRYLIVTDDTGLPDRGTKRTPLVVALSENGTLDSEPVPIAGIKKMDDAESICAGPDGTFFLATSHSPNDDGETHKSRRLLLHLKVANRSLKVLGQLDLTELDGSQSLLEVAGLPKDGRLDVEALAYRDRSLYIGLKSPLAKNGAAVILRLSDPVKAAHDRRVRVGSLVAFAQVLLCIPVDDQSVCQGRGRPIAVCVELARGPIVSALLEYDFFVIFPINPAMLARYRRTFSPSRAKDDPKDAFLALDLFRHHPERLAPLRRERPAMRALQALVQSRRTLVDDRCRIINRLTYALKEYFPQVVRWFREKYTDIFIDFVTRWPTLDAAKRAHRDTLVDFFHTHNVRGRKTPENRINAIKAARPLTTDPAVVEPNRLVAEALLAQIAALSKAIDRFDAQISERSAELPDFKIFAALPGAGAALAPRLLAAFGENRDRFPNAASLQKYAAIAPVVERSGNKSWTHWRFIGPTFLRQTFVEWVGETVPHSFWAKTFYESRSAKGIPHHVILRALAFKWIRIIWRCWYDRQLYDEARYLMALQKRHSPIIAHAAQPQ